MLYHLPAAGKFFFWMISLPLCWMYRLMIMTKTMFLNWHPTPIPESRVNIYEERMQRVDDSWLRMASSMSRSGMSFHSDSQWRRLKFVEYAPSVELYVSATLWSYHSTMFLFWHTPTLILALIQTITQKLTSYESRDDYEKCRQTLWSRRAKQTGGHADLGSTR